MYRSTLATALFIVMILSTANAQRFTRVIRDISGNPMTGMTVKLYTAGTATLAYTLTEDMTAPGTYYKDNVTAGYYDVYVNNVKKQSNIYHADQIKFGAMKIPTKWLQEGKYFMMEGSVTWGMLFDSVRVSGDSVIVKFHMDRTAFAQTLSDSGVVTPPKFGTSGSTTSKNNYVIRGNGASGVIPTASTSGDTVIVELDINATTIVSRLRAVGFGAVEDTLNNLVSVATDSVTIWYLGEMPPSGFRYQRISSKDSITTTRLGWREFRIKTQGAAVTDLRGLTFYSDSANKVSLLNIEWRGNSWGDDNTSVPSCYSQTYSGTAGKAGWNSNTWTSTSHTESAMGGTAFAPTWQLVQANSSAIMLIDGSNGQRRWATQLKPASTSTWAMDLRVKIWYSIPHGSASTFYVSMKNGL